MAHEVFLSYSHLDKAKADAVCHALEAASIRVWMAPRDIFPGAEWAESIIRAIGAARAVVLVFSRSSNASRQVRNEIERAINRRLPVILFRIENAAPSEALELFVSSSQWLDAFAPFFDRHLDSLTQAVCRLLLEPAAYEEARTSVAEPEHRQAETASPTPEASAATENRVSITPKLAVSCGEDGRYFETRGRGLYSHARIIKLKIENIDPQQAITNIRVAIQGIAPHDEYVGPWEVASGISLAAGDHAFVPLIEYVEASQAENYSTTRFERSDSFFVVLTKDHNKPCLSKSGEHIIDVRVTGIEAMACDRKFKVWVANPEGRLRIADA